MIIYKLPIESSYDDKQYWEGVYQEIFDKRTSEEIEREHRYRISMNDEEQKASMELMAREKNEYAARMGFPVGGYVMNDKWELFYVLSASFSGSIINVENAVFSLYPVEDPFNFSAYPEYKYFGSTKLIRAYHKDRFLYGIDEKINRYENYSPVKVEPTGVMNS